MVGIKIYRFRVMTKRKDPTKPRVYYTTEYFIERATPLHGGAFDYSEVNYINSVTPVVIICKEHGRFEQTPSAHLAGKGCYRCGREETSKKLTVPLRQVVSKIKQVRGDKYDYSKSKRLKEQDITIRCRIHGEFRQNISAHLKGSDCPACTGYSPIKPDLSHINTPEGSRALPLTKGAFAIVDEEDYEDLMQYNWHLTKAGYANTSRPKIYMHRYIMDAPKGMSVDHINHNTLDNRKSNLRICTHQQNLANSRHSSGTSKYRGVSWCKLTKRWVAEIWHKNKKYYLGGFDCEVEAAKVRDKKALELNGEFAWLNFNNDVRG